MAPIHGRAAPPAGLPHEPNLRRPPASIERPGGVAQRLERRTHNPQVGGSNPPAAISAEGTVGSLRRFHFAETGYSLPMRLLISCLAALVLAPIAPAATPLIVGVTEDGLKFEPDATRRDATELGLDAVRITLAWRPGKTAPDAEQR